jgi:hypothetical protein
MHEWPEAQTARRELHHRLDSGAEVVCYIQAAAATEQEAERSCQFAMAEILLVNTGRRQAQYADYN